MKHARADYDRIQDPAGLIPEDEPVFLIRGQDILAPLLLRLYAEQYRMQSGADPALARLVWDQANEMARWQASHGRKLADLPA